MVLKSSIVILAASLLGCEGMGPKEPRLKKMMAEDEATSANSKGINFGLPPTTVPGSDGGDGSNPTVPGSGGSGSDSGRNGGSDGNGGSNGGIMGLKFYCSKDTSKQMKTDMHKAMGVSLKLYNSSGAVVAEDSDIARAQSRRTSILTSRSAQLTFNQAVLDGTYYLALCDVAQHAACHIPSDRRADPLDKDDGKYSRAIVGFADNLVIASNQVSSVGQAKVLFPLPLTKQEEEDCGEVDSPLIIDLADNGLNFSSVADGVFFDLDGNRKMNKTAWPTDADDAFLALDLNHNGNIDSGAELFGNHSIGPDGMKSVNGFLSLGKYDENRDGKIDANDAIYSALLLWKDKNKNGISEADELVSLDREGIVSIELDYVELLERDRHGMR